MTATTLLDDLKAAGVDLHVVGDSLELDAPAGVLTSALVDQIRQHKLDLVAALGRPSGNGLSSRPVASTVTDLERRLNRGWELIAQAEAAGNDAEVTRLTNFWLSLLRRYEREYDDMTKARTQ